MKKNLILSICLIALGVGGFVLSYCRIAYYEPDYLEFIIRRFNSTLPILIPSTIAFYFGIKRINFICKREVIEMIFNYVKKRAYL
jgi:hypothetical protein